MYLKTVAFFSSLMVLSTAALANERTVYGVNEKARLAELELNVPAKLDTGAVTASLSALNIEMFEREDDDWVRFDLAVEGSKEGKTLERPVVRIAEIKRRADDIRDGESKDYTTRPVIEMEVCLGNEHEKIEVNLTDRTAFSYPLLIGSTALQQFDAVVDPSLRYSAGDPGCA